MFNLSVLADSIIDFKWMTASQIAVLVIALVFSIFSVATSIIAYKYANKLNSFIKIISMVVVAPFIAITSWLFLVFSFLDGFRNDEALNVVISILIAIFICGVIIIVAKALYAKNGHIMSQEDDTIEGSIEDQTNALPASTTLLLEDEKTQDAEEEKETEENDETSEDKEPAEESNIEESEQTEEKPLEGVQIVEDSEEVPAQEETTEEVEQTEETTEEVEETPVEETEEIVPEETNIEENDQTEEETDSVQEVTETEEAIEETADTDENEIFSLDEDEDEQTEEDDDDEEFKKFLEALRARNRIRTSDTDNDDQE